jgi:ribonuclease HI
MTPEQLLEEILLLPDEQRDQLFALLRERPTLRAYLAESQPPLSQSWERGPGGEGQPADYLLIWDGGSKGNPGQGYGSYQFTSAQRGNSLTESLEFAGRMTNNEAEYETLIAALEKLAAMLRARSRDPQKYSLDIRGDSLLVINQILGKWKAKNARMAAYRDRARLLLAQFGAYTLTHHDRSYSVAALGH